MNLYFFPKYTQKGPSSRYRTYQYLPYFSKYNLEVFPFFDESYAVGKKFSLKYLLKSFFFRIGGMLKIKKTDLVFLEYEFTPYLPFNILFFILFKIDYVVDFDDAVFHNYDQHPNKIIRFLLKNKIKNVIKYASYVVTGSPYLTVFALKYNTNVVEIPTSINLKKYQIKTPHEINNDEFVIGWIGSKTTSKNLTPLIPTFEVLQKKGLKFKLHFIGFDTSLENKFKHLPVKFITWDGVTEVAEIKKFSVGIMPLENILFNKGKCAFKLIQYMACGVPTIASPFDANMKVDRNNENLFAETQDEWLLAFVKMLKNKKYYQEIGTRNKLVIKQEYSIQSNYSKYIELFDTMIRKS